MLLFCSNSPRRIALLRQVGITTEGGHVRFHDGVRKYDYPQPLSLAELREHTIKAAWRKIEHEVNRMNILTMMRLAPAETVVAGADTVVFCEDHVLHRPMHQNPRTASRAQTETGMSIAREMLMQQRGKTVHIVTGLVVAQGDNLANARSRPVVTEAILKEFSPRDVDEYVRTGEPLDKSGAYGIQERGVALFTGIRGSYTNVVGLPLAEFLELVGDPLFAGRFHFPTPSSGAQEMPLSHCVPKVSLLVVGDVTYELSCDDFPNVTSEMRLERTVRRGVGGTGSGLAFHGSAAGFSPCAIAGVVGEDALGSAIHAELTSRGIDLVPGLMKDRQTSVTVALRQPSPSSTTVRLEEPRTALPLSASVTERVEQADVVVVAGEWLADERTRTEAISAAAQARQAGRLVVLQVRPGLSRQLRYEDVITWLHDTQRGRPNVDILAISVPDALAWSAINGREDDWGLIRQRVWPVLQQTFSACFFRTADGSSEFVATRAGAWGPWTPDGSTSTAEESAIRHLCDLLSPRVLLASASPRRFELLRQIIAANKVEVRRSQHDEAARSGEAPRDRVRRLAREKARAVLRSGVSPAIEIIIGADTEVVLPDGRGGEEIMPHPSRPSEATLSLQRLEGREHEVITGVAVLRRGGPDGKDVKEIVDCVSTTVRFRKLTAREIADYVASGEPLGKAGGYGIQGRGAMLIERIDGSYSNVVGLPLERLTDILARDFDMPIWQIDRVSGWRLPSSR